MDTQKSAYRFVLSVAAVLLTATSSLANEWLSPDISVCSTDKTAVYQQTLLSPDGQYIFISDDENNTSLFRSNGQKLGSIPAYYGAAAFSADSQQLITGISEKWQTPTGESDHYGGLGVTWSLDGKRINQSFNNKDEEIYHDVIRTSPNGKYILANGLAAEQYEKWGNLGFTLFDKQWKPLLSFETVGSVADVAFSPDSQLLLVAESPYGEPTPASLRSIDGKTLHEFDTGEAQVESVAFSADGQTAALGTYDGFVSLFDLKGNKKKELSLKTADNSAERVFAVAFSPDGTFFVTSSAVDIETDFNIRLWQNDGTLIKQFIQPYQKGESLSFSKDGKKLLIGCQLYTVSSQASVATQPVSPHVVQKTSNNTTPDADTALSDAAFIYYYDGYPMVSVHRSYEAANDCQKTIDLAKENNQVTVAITSDPGYDGKTLYQAKLQSDGQFQSENEYYDLSGTVNQDLSLKATLVINGKSQTLQRTAPKKTKQEYVCQNKKLEEGRLDDDSYQHKSLFFTAIALTDNTFGKRQLQREKRYIEKKFAEFKWQGYGSMARGVAADIKQRIVYAKGDLFSLCQDRDVYLGGASNYAYRECRAFYQGQLIEITDLFYDATSADLFMSDLSALIAQVTGIDGKLNLTHLTNNFYVDYDSVVLILNYSEYGGKEIIEARLPFDKIADIANLSVIGR